MQRVWCSRVRCCRVSWPWLVRLPRVLKTGLSRNCFPLFLYFSICSCCWAQVLAAVAALLCLQWRARLRGAFLWVLRRRRVGVRVLFERSECEGSAQVCLSGGRAGLCEGCPCCLSSLRGCLGRCAGAWRSSVACAVCWSLCGWAESCSGSVVCGAGCWFRRRGLPRCLSGGDAAAACGFLRAAGWSKGLEAASCLISSASHWLLPAFCFLFLSI